MLSNNTQQEDVVKSTGICTTSLNNNVFVEPAFLTQVGIFLTYRCTISCRHCLVGAGPLRTEEIDLNEAMGWLHQIRNYENGKIQSIGFTGGEPFCCYDKLLKLADLAHDLGLNYTVITNGFWASSKQKARKILSRLLPSDLSISSDIFHQEFIPVENVENVFKSCQELGIRCDITFAYDDHVMKQTKMLVKQLLRFASKQSIRVTRIFPSGRGGKQADFSEVSVKDKPPSRIPCLFATVPYILPDGGIIACIGPLINIPRKNNPLFLGSLRHQSLSEIFHRSENNPVLHGLRIWGPEFWHQIVEEQGPQSSLPQNYYTDCPCEGCITLLKKPDVASFLMNAVHAENLISKVKLARKVFLDE